MRLRLLILLAPVALLAGCAGISTASRSSATDNSPGQLPHSVNLWWEASTSTDITGYNVYRSAYTDSCGSFSRINTAVITTTSYTDAEVSSGGSYCYATTAVNASKQESGYSNVIINVQIPTP